MLDWSESLFFENIDEKKSRMFDGFFYKPFIQNFLWESMFNFWSVQSHWFRDDAKNVSRGIGGKMWMQKCSN